MKKPNIKTKKLRSILAQGACVFSFTVSTRWKGPFFLGLAVLFDLHSFYKTWRTSLWSWIKSQLNIIVSGPKNTWDIRQQISYPTATYRTWYEKYVKNNYVKIFLLLFLQLFAPGECFSPLPRPQSQRGVMEASLFSIPQFAFARTHHAVQKTCKWELSPRVTPSGSALYVICLLYIKRSTQQIKVAFVGWKISSQQVTRSIKFSFLYRSFGKS